MSTRSPSFDCSIFPLGKKSFYRNLYEPVQRVLNKLIVHETITQKQSTRSTVHENTYKVHVKIHVPTSCVSLLNGHRLFTDKNDGGLRVIRFYDYH